MSGGTGTTGVIVQARMSSQRLPGKVLRTLPSAGDPDLTVLDWVVGRAACAPSVDVVVVATSTDASDDVLAELCAARGYRCERGSLDDVLDRFTGAARAVDAREVVRLTADCPLVDPAVIEEVLRAHRRSRADFTANRLPPPHPRTFPVGLDVEIADRAALERAWAEACEPHHREHVMPYLYEEPGRFRVHVVDTPLDAGQVRWTVDTRADLEAVRALVRLAGADMTTPWRRLLEVWRSHPELAALNAGVVQRTGRHVDPSTS